jgi:hypothetical protein
VSKRKGPPLGKELLMMEAANPALAKLAENIEVTKQRIINGTMPHPLPCRDESCKLHHE